MLGFGLEVCVFDQLLAIVIEFIDSMLSQTDNPGIVISTHTGVSITKC